MEHYHLAIGWLWEYDEDFVLALEHEAQQYRQLSTFQIHDNNIDEVLDRVRKRELSFGLFLDRGFDIDERFEHLGKLVMRHGGSVVNSYEHTIEAIDKASVYDCWVACSVHDHYFSVFTTKRD
jgi:hypothetical protein